MMNQKTYTTLELDKIVGQLASYAAFSASGPSPGRKWWVLGASTSQSARTTGPSSAQTRAIVEASTIPVTVKTRLGWDENSKNIVAVAEQLQDQGISALTIHGRTRAQMYKGTADWTLIGEVKDNPRMHIPIIGNGDITNPYTCHG